jgi:hypothetical protein
MKPAPRNCKRTVPGQPKCEIDVRVQPTFNLVHDLCRALATAKDLEALLAAYAYVPPTCQFLRGLEPMMADDVAMLDAILQRMIMNGVEAGMPLQQAVDEAAYRHAQAVARAPSAREHAFGD